VVNGENDPTLMYLLEQLRDKENCDTENALAFFFQKDSICPADDGRVLKLREAEMHQRVSELGQFDKIVFVKQKLQQDVNAKMESHFKIHKAPKANAPDGWLGRDKVTKDSLLNIFNNNCELMVSVSPANPILSEFLIRNVPCSPVTSRTAGRVHHEFRGHSVLENCQL
jgi:hypothetical protein